jgi:hypothetical protein
MPPPALKLGLAREYRKLQPGVKLLSTGNLRLEFGTRFFDLSGAGVGPNIAATAN